MQKPVKNTLPVVDFLGLGGLAGLGSLGEMMTADQLIGKTLYAKRNVKAYYDATQKRSFRTFAAGQPIGVVFSWVTTNGTVLWQIEGNPQYFVANEGRNFDLKLLQEQGAQTIEELKKAAEQKKLDERSTIDKVSDSFSKTVSNTADLFSNTSKVLDIAIPIAIVAGIGLVGYSVFRMQIK